MIAATLIIHDGEQFCEDIWQYKSNFDRDAWESAIQTMAGAAQKAYDFLNEYTDFPTHELFQLGDLCNMLASISVTKEG